MTALDPYIAIDADYGAAVNAAVAAHEQDVASLNAQLAADLEAAVDEAERFVVLEAFEVAVAPVRAAYNAAVAQAEQDRDAAKAAAAAGHQAHVDDLAVQAANAATLRSRANTALTTNNTFLAITTPTNAQNAAQAKALTRQNNAMIKLLLGLLDDLNGT